MTTQTTCDERCGWWPACRCGGQFLLPGKAYSISSVRTTPTDTYTPNCKDYHDLTKEILQTTSEEELANSIIKCIEDYGLTVPSINYDKAISIAKTALEKAYNDGYNKNAHDINEATK